LGDKLLFGTLTLYYNYINCIFVDTPMSKTQSTTDSVTIQPSPAYVPMHTLNANTIPQYETVQDCSDVKMDANPAYLSHKNI